MTEQRIIRIEFGSKNEMRFIGSVWYEDTEPAPPKDWAQQMKGLEERNIRLSRFIMDWLGRELEGQHAIPGYCLMSIELEDSPMTFIEGDHHKNKEDGTPVPPKDWKPYCFSDFDKDGKCDHDEYYMMASCDKCPFTK